MNRILNFIALCIILLAGCQRTSKQYEPTWESLSGYGQGPKWFMDAKLGFWAHWGPQCEPENGDWYARIMYMEGNQKSTDHRERYGHPSEFGFKDIINEWNGEKWDPEYLVKRFKESGAKYFVGMANHHDNFDLWDSSHHNWNSVNMGPRRNVIGEWEKAARNSDLPFGVSIHASHAWNFYESAQGSDTEGPYAGIPYDGRITIEDGKGKWWDGYDPQELYVQEHPVSLSFVWEWQDTISVPSIAYKEKFLKRHIELVDRYKPDLVYFDDTVLPFWPVSNEGIELTAHIYNTNSKAVVTGKVLKEEHKNALVFDVERGVTGGIQEKPWQTCTCLGNWHYDRTLYEQNGYKPAGMVIKMLIDIVSKNGNLLLSVPIRGDGTIDEKEEAILDEMSAWLKINGESIYGTRPWKIYGEGPDVENPDDSGSEWRKTPYTSEDIRFTSKGDILYVFPLDWPTDGNTIIVDALKENSEHYTDRIKKVFLLGYNKALKYHRTEEGLLIELPDFRPNDISPVIKIIRK